MPTLYTKRNIIVIQAGDLATANAQALLVDPQGGANTFHATLSTTGSPPATNYWCNWAMLPSQDTDIRGRLSSLVNTGRVKIFDGMTTTPTQVLASVGLGALFGAPPPPVTTALEAFGDSITAGYLATNFYGWAHMVAASKGWTLHDAAVAGAVIADQLPSVLALNVTPSTVSVCLFGANDRWQFGLAGVSSFQTTLTTMLTHLAVGKVYVGTTLPYGSPFIPGHLDFQAEYNAVIRSVAASTGAIVVESAAAITDVSTMLSDGIHPNDAGHAAIASVFGTAIP